MNRSVIIHPKLMAKLRLDFYPSCCDVQERVIIQSATGHANESYVTKYADVDCRISPALSGERARGQVNTSQDDYDKTTHDIALNGRYVDIDATMRALVRDEPQGGSVAYDIVRADYDDQQAMTVLRCKRVQ